MSFWDITPSPEIATKPKPFSRGSFWNTRPDKKSFSLFRKRKDPFAAVDESLNVPIPDTVSPAARAKILRLRGEAQKDVNVAKKKSSFWNLAGQTAKGVGEILSTAERETSKDIVAAIALGDQPKLFPNAQPRKGKNIFNIVKPVPGAERKGLISSTQRAFRDLEASELKRLEALSRAAKFVNEREKAGLDASGTKAEIQRQLSQGGVELSKILPALDKTNAQVVADVLGVGVDVITAGNLQSIAKAPGLLKTALLHEAEGIGTGYAQDVVTAFQEGKTGPEAFKPGISTAVGAAVGAIPGTVALSKRAKELFSTMTPAQLQAGFVRLPGGEELKMKTLPYNEKEYQEFLTKVKMTDEQYRAKLKEQGFDGIQFGTKMQAYDQALQEAKDGRVFGMRPERAPIEKKIPEPVQPVTREMRSALEDLGYTTAEAKTLKYAEAKKAIEDVKPDFFTAKPKPDSGLLKERPVYFNPTQAKQFEQLKTERDLLGEQLKDHPGRYLVQFVSKREKQFMDLPSTNPKFSDAKNAAIKERRKKIFRAAERAFEGHPVHGYEGLNDFEDPDVIREAIEGYNKIKNDVREVSQSIRKFREGVRVGKLEEADATAIDRISERAQKRTEKEIDKNTRLAERKKAFDEGVARTKKEAEEASRKKENIRRAHLEEDKPLNIFQKIRNKLLPAKGLDQATGDALRSWRAKRIKAPILAEKEMGQINVPREKGLDVILDYQAGKSTKYSKAISEKFDSLYKEAEKRGLDFEYRENYLPQVYRESSDEVKDKIRDYLTSRGMTADDIALYIEGKPLPSGVASNMKLTPYFAKDRVFPDYKSAMEWGLTPRFTDIDQLAAHYRDELEKTIANKELLDDLISQGKLIPEQVAPASWIPVQNLPLGQRGYYAKPRLADVLDGMFKNTEELSPLATGLDYVARLSRTLQEIALSAGVPKSNINFFSIGQTIKELTAGNLKAIPTFLRANFNKPSIKFFEKNREYLEMMAQEGIDLGDRIGSYAKVYESWVQQFKDTVRGVKPTKKSAIESGKGFAKLAGSAFDKLFNEKTFGSFMPQLYTQTFKDTYLNAIRKGMDGSEARKLAGQTVRNMFGMVDSVGRSKVTQDALGAAFFAPRFREAIINTLFKTGKAGVDFVTKLGGARGKLDPALKRNRKLLAGMIISFGAYNALNKQLNGYYMWENPPGREFALRIPRKNGDPVYVEFMPSFLAFARNMIGAGVALVKGDVKTSKKKISGVLSMPVSLTMQMVGNYDYFGNPIYKDTDTSGVKATKLAKHLGLQANHPYVKELINQINDKKPLLESIVAALELPLKFSTKNKESTNKFYASLDKAAKENARATEKFKPIYNEIQEMIEQGKTVEAQDLVDNLSDDDYAIYKKLKASDKARATKSGEAAMFDTVLKVKDLIAEGKTQEAQDIVEGLDDEEYRLYKLAKKRLPPSEQY